MTHPPHQSFPHILGMIREKPTIQQGNRGVIGEVIEDSWEGIWVLEVDEAEVGASREVFVLCVAAVNIGKQIAPHSKGEANFQGHLQGDGVLIGVVLVVVAGDHTPHDTRGNNTRLQPTYRRLCTQHGARRETRGIVEGAHRGPPWGWTPHGNSGWQQTTKGSGEYWNYIFHCNKRHNHRQRSKW